TLGFESFEFHINHRGLLRALIRTAGIDLSQEGTALQAVDKLDKIGRDGVLDELEARGVDRSAGETLLGLISEDATIEGLKSSITDEEGQRALVELEELLALLEHTPAAGKARFSPQLARGLGYYTGPIFEARVTDLGSSIAGGGRYDELVGMFGKQSVPAVGLSLGLERILVVMAELDMFPELAQGPDVMVCWRGVEREAVLKVAHAMRAQGLRVEVYPEPTKLGKQIQYADAAGVGAAWVGVLGDREIADGTVSLKHLETGKQSDVAVADVASVVRG
ncbi:MAG: ATP phosphoribosyltransferase regulatory subunit, partial [Nannocystaceae bacterium]|nr:ATP phosphoribosyltransferase regulatory subunit [Nannocystaceae bacterium]